MTGLNGKTALLTGASRGMGKAVALRMAGEGALLAVHYASDDEAAKQTVSAIERAGGRAFTIRMRPDALPGSSAPCEDAPPCDRQRCGDDDCPVTRAVARDRSRSATAPAVQPLAVVSVRHWGRDRRMA